MAEKVQAISFITRHTRHQAHQAHQAHITHFIHISGHLFIFLLLIPFSQASPSWSSWSLLVLQPPPGFHHLLWGVYVLELLPDATQPPHALTMGNTFLPNPTYANQDQVAGW